MKFKKTNINPPSNKTNDCVIRSICNALNKNWKKVYVDLFELSFNKCKVFNDMEIIREYLKNYEMVVPKIVKGSKRPKVKDFTKGTYILSIANHFTMVRDGSLFDTWDCREKAVYRFWVVEK